jgi:hypothetical protein
LAALSGVVVPEHRAALCGTRAAEVLVRVDDFPRWDVPLEAFQRFHQVLQSHHIPYALGVTPFLQVPPREGRLTDAEWDALRRLAAAGVTLAHHGFTHVGRLLHDRAVAELPWYTDAELRYWIQRADEAFERATLPRARVMMPPFDGITPGSAQLLVRRYDVITGGPASLSTLGPVARGVVLGGGVYLPSYFMHMYATRLFPRLDRRLWEDATGPVTVLTIHWAWEIGDGYTRLSRMLRALEGRVIPWSKLTDRLPGNERLDEGGGA